MSEPGPLSRFLFSGGSPERLAATRFVLGLGLVPFFAMQYGSLFDFEAFGLAWYYTDPVWYFDALGIRRHVPWLAMCGVPVLLGALVAFALGFRTRLAACVILLLVLLLKGARDSVAGDIHHRELIPFQVLLFFALSRCGDVYSLDAQRGSRAPPLTTWEASWPIRASELYVAAFYIWSGLAKLRVSGMAWLEGGGGMQSLLLQRAVRFGLGSDGEPAGSNLGLWLAHYPDALALLALGVLAMELGFPLVLLLRRSWTRALFLAGVTLFHLANFVLMDVQFVFLPVVFAVFFDPAPLFRHRLHRLPVPLS